jgi:hypothetical protein
MDHENPSTGASLPGRLHAAVRNADPETGEVKAAPSTAAALVKNGLAVRFGSTGRHYLTAAGRTLRSTVLGAVGETAARPASPEGVFTAATGDGPEVAGDGAEGRRAEVAAAWAGVLGMRHLEGDVGAPCVWERAQPVRAVAIALEAGGVRPSARDAAGHWTAVGYRVLSGPGGARVEWRGPASSSARQEAERELGRCASVLAAAGWDCLQYLGRQHLRYLAVQPQ